MQKQLNVGVIGCGYWGPNVIRNLRALPDCRIAAICDLQEDRLARMQRLYPEITVTTDVDGFLESPEIEAIAIATPSDTHYDLALRSLGAGKHVIVEKPMAASVQACRELIECAEARGLTLMVGHTFVYSAPVRFLKRMVDAGELGEIRYINSHRLNLGLFQKDINVAWDLAPHDISIILFLLGTRPLSVNCQGSPYCGSGIEAVTTMALDFPNGVFATIQSSWIDPIKTRLMTVVGTEKMVVYDDTAAEEKIRVYDKRVSISCEDEPAPSYSYHTGDIHAPRITPTEPLAVECQHFLDCIRTGSQPESSCYDGMHVVEILEAASRSLGEAGTRIVLARSLASSPS